MYSFLPQILIIVAIVGIIIIILRRTPEVRERMGDFDYKKFAMKAWGLLQVFGKKLWHFILEVKDIPKKPHFPEFAKKGLNQINFSRWKHDRPKTEIADSQDADSNATDFEQAEKEFIQVIEQDPHNEEAFAGLGRLYMGQKKYKEAIQTYLFLTKHYSDNDGYYSHLAQAYHNEKKYEKAINAYEKSIELAPGNPKRYVNLGLTLKATKHIEEAMLNFRKAVDMESDNLKYLDILASALVENKEDEEAIKIYEKILQLEPTNHDAREKLMHLKY